VDRKKRFATMDRLFQNIDPYGQGALTSAANTVVYLPIERVRPDPAQPRRVLPPAIAAAFRQTGDAAAALAAWVQLARSDEPARAAYQDLTSLADTLAVDGLINPITVIPLNDEYQIISGERRWWAHQWLAAQSRAVNHGQPGHIAALVRHPDEITPTLQLVENLHRQDLCAVEVALGLAALIERLEALSSPQSATTVALSDPRPAESATTVALPNTPPPQSATMVALSDPRPVESATTVALSTEQRLAHLQAIAAHRLSKGIWEDILSRLGRTRQHWAHYLALLGLADETLRLAWEHHLSERALRPAVAEKDPARQLRLVEQIVRQQRAVTDESSRSAGAAATTGPATQEAAEPFSRLFAGELRAFQRALDRAADQRVPPATLARALAQTANFDELVKTAKRLKPFVDALAQAAAKK
jgi:ParB/RepB/Spo0J family partition protein